MATIDSRAEPPLIVIVGPTASGKTRLAIQLARGFNGEIISADSRAVYKGLDIGTAKPTTAEQQQVPHWGIDLVLPSERYSASDFKQYAIQKIAEIRSRGNVPLLVGGTGLYIDSVLYDFEFVDTAGALRLRSKLETMSLELLHEHCKNNNVILPENFKNKRYVINAILRSGQPPKRREEPITNSIIVGIATDKMTLRERIESRAEEIFTPEVIKEALIAAEKYGWDNEAMTGNIYPLVRQYTEGAVTIDEAKLKSITLDWRLAKRQLTWLKRSEHIRWLSLEEAYTYCARALVKLNKP